MALILKSDVPFRKVSCQPSDAVTNTCGEWLKEKKVIWLAIWGIPACDQRAVLPMWWSKTTDQGEGKRQGLEPQRLSRGHSILRPPAQGPISQMFHSFPLAPRWGPEPSTYGSLGNRDLNCSRKSFFLVAFLPVGFFFSINI